MFTRGLFFAYRIYIGMDMRRGGERRQEGESMGGKGSGQGREEMGGEKRKTKEEKVAREE